MKIISTTTARKNISRLVDRIKVSGETVALGRRRLAEVLVIPFPSVYNERLDEVTNYNAYSKSFDFLEDEPDLYTLDDVKKTYV